jgi:hypothetical protein
VDSASVRLSALSEEVSRDVGDELGASEGAVEQRNPAVRAHRDGDQVRNCLCLGEVQVGCVGSRRAGSIGGDETDILGLRDGQVEDDGGDVSGNSVGAGDTEGNRCIRRSG